MYVHIVWIVDQYTRVQYIIRGTTLHVKVSVLRISGPQRTREEATRVDSGSGCTHLPDLTFACMRITVCMRLTSSFSDPEVGCLSSASVRGAITADWRDSIA